MSTLNLFPARVAIGILQQDGTVLPSPEFFRALAALFERVGGPSGMGSDDLALNIPLDQGAAIAVLARQITALQAQVTQADGVRAELAELRKALGGVEQQATHRDPFRVNWERPGRIGALTPNTAAFTTATATTFNKLTLTAPATGATLTLADGKTFTVSNTLTLTATDGATLAIGGGGTLRSAAYTPSSDYAPAGGGGADWTAGKFGCNGKTPQAAAASGGTLAGVIAALVANGILSS